MRILFLANSRAGKTSTIRAFLEAAPRACLTLIHDVKEADPQYFGHWQPDVTLDGVPDDAEAVVFHGDPYTGKMPEVDDVAALALACARGRAPVRLLVDELSRATTDGGQALSSPRLSECYTQGGGLGLSVLATNQIPQRTPLVPRDQATAVVFGVLGRGALNYLNDRLFLDGAMVDAVENLRPGEPGRGGEVVIHLPGVPWNRVIYDVPAVPAPTL